MAASFADYFYKIESSDFFLWYVAIPFVELAIGLTFTHAFKWEPTVKQKMAFLGALLVASLLIDFIIRTVTLSAKLGPQMTGEPAAPQGPDFTGMIEGVGQAKSEDDTIVILFVDIENRGAPSVVWQWDMEITLLSGQRIEPKRNQNTLLPLMSAATASMTVMSGSAPMKLDATTFLPYTLGQTPLETGAAKEGWAEFNFGHVHGDEIMRPGTVYTLKLMDGRGKIYPVGLTLQPTQ